MGKRQMWLGVLSGVLVPAAILAADVVLPHVFVPGGQVKSSEFNANFEALRQEINLLKRSMGASDGGVRGVSVSTPSGTRPIYSSSSPGSQVGAAPYFELDAPNANGKPNAIITATGVTRATLDVTVGTFVMSTPSTNLYYEAGRWRFVCFTLETTPSTMMVPCERVNFIIAD